MEKRVKILHLREFIMTEMAWVNRVTVPNLLQHESVE